MNPAQDAGVLSRPEDHHRRARAEWKRGNLRGALVEFQNVLAMTPGKASALSDLALLLLDGLNNVQSAERFSRRAVAADPCHAPGYVVLGNVMKARGDDAAAAENYRRALAIDGQLADPMVNLGVLSLESGDMQGALDWFTRALQAEPAHVNGRWNRGNLLLLLGRYAEGWEDYEYRFRIEGRNASRQPAERRQCAWDGSGFRGKTLLVWCEQGLGDTLQFVRYLPLVKERGGTVVFECQEELVPLLRTFPGADAVIASWRLRRHGAFGAAKRAFCVPPKAGQSPPRNYDFTIPLLSLPRIFGTTADSIPASVPYIQADPGLVESCRGEFQRGVFSVGLAWRGNPCHPNDPARSCSPSDLEALADVPGVQLYSLQKTLPGGVRGQGVLEGRAIDLSDRLSDFAATAAYLAHIDLLITVDTAIAHLAGAMGKPVWVLIPRIPDWRWQLDREETPWYPTMRLFRQTVTGDWSSPVGRISVDLTLAAAGIKGSGDSLELSTGFVEKGSACFNAGDTEGALRFFREALAADPADSRARNALGVVLTHRGELEAAAVELRRAIELDPRNAEARYNLGNVQKQQGQLREAAASYREAIAESPDLIQAEVNLGVVLNDMGDPSGALEEYRNALAIDPTSSSLLKQVGELCLKTGDTAGALEAFERAIDVDPGDVALIHRVGALKQSAGNLDEAIALFRKGVDLHPDNADAWADLGTALVLNGEADAALVALERAIRIRPDFPGVLNNLGMVMKEKGRPGIAKKCFTLAIRSDPSYATAHNNLGTVLLDGASFQEAEAQFREAVNLQVDYLLAWNNLGNALAGQGKFHEAKQIYRLVIAQDPGIPEVHFNLASALAFENRFAESLRGYEEAVRIKPDYAEARLNRALILLQTGEFEEGWKEYEWRIRVRDPRRLYVPPAISTPRWDGSDPAGKRILVRAEQGFGDSFQFARFLPLLAARGAEISFECPKEVIGLFREFPGVDTLIAFGDPPPACDAFVELLSLPGMLGTKNVGDIPWSGPYIHADPPLVERLGPLFGEETLNVGIVWGGNPLHKNDHNRSCRLAGMLPLSDVPGVCLYSLQKGNPALEVSSLPPGRTLRNLEPELTDFSVTAAALAHLDLLIAVDTSVAHLAGAMGVPVWLLLPYRSDWRWLSGRADSPWYPSMRLFRQKSHGDWEGVINEVALSLRALSAKQSPAGLLRGACGAAGAAARNDREKGADHA
ncbi:MAG TPA: tetratricopeptide repeat protein [Bacteroidota bacterium]|nr:tetratricopeptide repeat protein [Bacteroidota bacterium]